MYVGISNFGRGSFKIYIDQVSHSGIFNYSTTIRRSSDLSSFDNFKKLKFTLTNAAAEEAKKIAKGVRNRSFVNGDNLPKGNRCKLIHIEGLSFSWLGYPKKVKGVLTLEEFYNLLKRLEKENENNKEIKYFKDGTYYRIIEK